MKRSFSVGLIFLLLGVGCAALEVPEWKPVYVPAPVSNVKNTSRFTASYDVVWKAVVRVYADRNIGVKTIEKDSGLIASENMMLQMDEFLKYMNPGKYDLGSEQYNSRPINPMLRTNIFVEKISNSMTNVRINLKGTVQWEASYKNYPYYAKPELGTTECESTGVLETAIFREIADKLAL